MENMKELLAWLEEKIEEHYYLSEQADKKAIELRDMNRRKKVKNDWMYQFCMGNACAYKNVWERLTGQDYYVYRKEKEKEARG